jgi:outer membrane protein
MRDLERARGEFNDDATARRNEEMSRLQRTLGEEVRNYAKAQNYDLILTAETLVYYTQTYDITPAILAALQAHGTAPASTRPAPTPPPAKPQPK